MQSRRANTVQRCDSTPGVSATCRRTETLTFRTTEQATCIRSPAFHNNDAALTISRANNQLHPN